jgi:hypothetical protein
MADEKLTLWDRIKNEPVHNQVKALCDCIKGSAILPPPKPEEDDKEGGDK